MTGRPYVFGVADEDDKALPVRVVGRGPRTSGQPDEPPPAGRLGSSELEQPTEPPVVARLVVEIRSDGSRTIARGAVDDLLNDQRVAIRAEGTTPMALAMSLAKSLFQVPALGRGMIRRALLGGRRKR